MKLIDQTENWVKCGRCNTEFDLNKNTIGCPLCGFGKEDKRFVGSNVKFSSHLTLPLPELKLKKVTPIVDEGTKLVGSWGMFNDFFSGKFVCRTLTHMIKEKGENYIKLSDLIEKAKMIVKENNLSELKGFPKDVDSDSSIGRLVYHFISTFYGMGLLDLKTVKNNADNIWSESWSNILITLTQDGYEFAKLRNKIFDENDRSSQTLTTEEKEWMIEFLKEIDKKGYKEYSILSQVHSFIKKGNNGKDLWKWFKENENFIRYLKSWSKKKSNAKEFQKQIANLSQTFASGKISLLRELGLISNRRNDYSIIGEL
jgi:hypothetical protein